jgi:adenylylsulfate reductase subunit B
MPTFVYMTRCDGCGHCVDICPSDIMHIDPTYRRAYNIEPSMCWECYSCVKACPQNAIDVRGYADFAPLGHSVRVIRDEDKGTIAWKIKYRNGTEKNFLSPITTKPWGQAIPKLADVPAPSQEMRDSQLLYNEPKWIRMDDGGLHSLQAAGLKLKKGVYSWSSAQASAAAVPPGRPGFGARTRRSLLPRKQISIAPARSRRVCMPSTATWGPGGAKINRRTTYATLVSI